jgi:hypothetical protein
MWKSIIITMCQDSMVPEISECLDSASGSISSHFRFDIALTRINVPHLQLLAVYIID